VFDTFIGTTNGIHRLRDGALELLGLESECISAVHAWRAQQTVTVLAGSYGNGLYRSADGGRSWSRVAAGLTASAFRYLNSDPATPGAILAGTEPARIFRSEDDGQTWRELDAITRIPGHDQWFLPYSPRAGAVRNIYAPPGRADRIFASVEVGGLLKSDDGGRSWVCEAVIADEDIHHITGHPQHHDLLYASLGTASLTRQRADDAPRQLGGIARSRDAGKAWRKVETDYTRATIIPPSQPDLLLAGPAPRVGQGGRIVVSADDGETWEPAGAGIEIPMPDMVELFIAAPDNSIWAICSRGRLLRADIGDWNWQPALPTGTALEVKAIAFLPHAT
jgi:photosystem II stability/assembly factor-like uncharacterized protein